MFFKRITRFPGDLPEESQGYQAPSTHSYNTHRITLKMSGSFSECDKKDKAQSISWLQVRVRLVPVEIEGTGPLLFYEDCFGAYDPVHLYDPSIDGGRLDVCAGVSVLFKEIKSYGCEGGDVKRPATPRRLENKIVIIPEGGILYRHSFLIQAGPDIKVCGRLDENRHMIMTPPGIPNGYAFWAYAGLYARGYPLDFIQQVYFSLTHQDGRAAIQLSTQRDWDMRNIPIPQGGVLQDGQIVFMDGGPHPPNLQAVLCGGAVILQLQDGVDDRGQPVVHTYESYDFKNEQADYVDLYLRKKP